MGESIIETKLRSISWRRPGIVEIIVHSKFSSKDKRADSGIDLKDVIDSSVGGFRLIESCLEFDGVSTTRVSRFQGSMLQASPTNDDGEDAEKEQWSANVIMDRRDIALHPRIDSILKAGWGSVYSGKVFWPRMIYKKTQKDVAEINKNMSEGELLSALEGNNEEEKPVKNSFYGTTSYFSPRIEITRDRLEDGGWQIDGEDLNKIGRRDSTKTLLFMQDLVLSGSSTKRVQSSLVLRTEWQGGVGVFIKEIYEG